MNKEVLESQWVQIQDLLSEKFSNLTEEDIRQINGRYDQLVAKLQQKYGYTREEAEEKIRSLNFDRFTAPRSHISREQTVIREEPVRREQNSSFYKWLFGLGIPLLLLGSFFLGTRTPDVTTTPVVTQEQMIAETPADRVITTGLRNTLLAQQQQNPTLAMQNIQITTHNGVVTLSGTASSADMRDLIGTTAQNFTGVRQVINHIEVK